LEISRNWNNPKDLERHISSLDLTGRAENFLLREGISTIGELVRYTPQRLLEIPLIGQASLRYIEAKLAGVGLRLSRVLITDPVYVYYVTNDAATIPVIVGTDLDKVIEKMRETFLPTAPNLKLWRAMNNWCGLGCATLLPLPKPFKSAHVLQKPRIVFRRAIPDYEPDRDDQPVGPPTRSVAIEDEFTGLRLVLDEQGDPAREYNVLIEHHPGHWLLVIHPNDGDPVCTIEFHEDHVEVRDAAGDTLRRIEL